AALPGPAARAQPGPDARDDDGRDRGRAGRLGPGRRSWRTGPRRPAHHAGLRVLAADDDRRRHRGRPVRPAAHPHRPVPGAVTRDARSTSLSAARRARELAELAAGRLVDVLVIGLGVTGAGVAL